MPKIGEVWKYRLYNEDCFETFKRIPDGSVDLVLCDPPYGTTACKWDSVIPTEPMWEELRRIVKSTTAVVLTSSQPFTSLLVQSNLPWFKYCWVWEKPTGTGFLDSKFRPLKVHEDVVVFSPAGCSTGSKPAMTYIPQMEEGEPYKASRKGRLGLSGSRSLQTRTDGEYDGQRFPRSVLNFSRDKPSVHPTQKPVALMEYLVRTYSNPGDLVLDFAMGSGTTGVACGRLGRRFIGCDNDTEHGYFQIAQKRIQEAYGA